VKGSSYESTQLFDVSGCTTGEIVLHLGPDKLDWIEFWRAGRKVVHMDTRMLSQELLYLLALMNGRFVPNQNDGATHMLQQMLQKINDLVTRQVALVRLGSQADFASTRRDQQGRNRIDALVVLNAGANLGRVSPWSPSSLERADQRLPIFVNQDKGCTQVTPLFLSWAKGTVSSGQSARHHAETRCAAAFDNSTPCAARDATHHSDGNGYGTTAKSHARCGQGSNSLQHNRGPRRLAGVLFPVASIVAASNGMDDEAVSDSASACGAAAVRSVASVEHCVASRRPFPQPVLWRDLVAAAPARAPAVRQAEGMFHLISCAI
jgi:hypothetical protein